MNSQNNPNHKPLRPNQKGDTLLNQKKENLRKRDAELRRYQAVRARMKAAVAACIAEAEAKMARIEAEKEQKHAEALAEIERRKNAVVTREDLISAGALNSSSPDEDKLRIAGLSIDENKPLTPVQEANIENYYRDMEEEIWDEISRGTF